jgi:hypothetical protein
MLKVVTMLARFIAAVTALTTTYSLVWGMATLGYPPSSKADAPFVLARACR